MYWLLLGLIHSQLRSVVSVSRTTSDPAAIDAHRMLLESNSTAAASVWSVHSTRVARLFFFLTCLFLFYFLFFAFFCLFESLLFFKDWLLLLICTFYACEWLKSDINIKCPTLKTYICLRAARNADKANHNGSYLSLIFNRFYCDTFIFLMRQTWFFNCFKLIVSLHLFIW